MVPRKSIIKQEADVSTLCLDYGAALGVCSALIGRRRIVLYIIQVFFSCSVYEPGKLNNPHRRPCAAEPKNTRSVLDSFQARDHPSRQGNERKI